MTYPSTPGYKDKDTSKQAAHKVAGKSVELRAKIMMILEYRQASADELAAALSEPVTTIRPRVTELFKQNKIQDTGIRRRAEGGCMAKVWGLTPVHVATSLPPIQYNFDNAGQGALFA